MALTHNGTRIDVNPNSIPTGYTKPTISTFDDWESNYDQRVFTIAKAGVENAVDDVTFTALVAQLNTDIEILINADYDTGVLTVTSWAKATIFKTNNDLDGVLYTNGALNYLVTVTIYIKTA